MRDERIGGYIAGLFFWGGLIAAVVSGFMPAWFDQICTWVFALPCLLAGAAAILCMIWALFTSR